MTDPLLSAEAAARVVAAHGEPGADWLRRLPDLLAELAAGWSLAEVGPPFAESCASLVVPVRGPDGAPLVLKLAPSRDWSADEARALAHWAGRGAVLLRAQDAERGALLVERAVPGTPLADLCAGDDRAATVAAAEVMRELRSASGEPDSALPALASWTGALASDLARAAPRELRAACDRAYGLAADLHADAGRTVVLHGDLHQRNLLRAEREPWLAIDPKGLRGPPEAEPAALLRNPRGFLLSHPDARGLASDRLDLLAERLGDDAPAMAGWAYVLAVLAAFWAYEDRGGEAEVSRWLACADVLGVVARARGAL